MSKEGNQIFYLIKPSLGLPASAKEEILDIIEKSGMNEMIYPDIQRILSKYGFLLETEPMLLIKPNPELPAAI